MKIEITEPKGKEILAISKSKDNSYYSAVLFNVANGEYIVAWNYDIENGTWGQGHYFSSYLCTLDEARKNAFEYYTQNYILK